MSDQLGELLYQLQPDAQTRTRIVLGRAATTVTAGQSLYVTIGAFDGHRTQWGPCRWCPANENVTRGQDVLVLFDEDDTPWVLLFQ